MHKNSYVLFFAAMVTITCSVLLSSAANLLKDRQQENIALDKRKNIIASAGFKSEEGKESTFYFTLVHSPTDDSQKE